jgi:hypothetical protein
VARLGRASTSHGATTRSVSPTLSIDVSMDAHMRAAWLDVPAFQLAVVLYFS